MGSIPRAPVQRFLPALEGGAVVAALERGARVMDLGCGGGAAARLIAAAFPAARVAHSPGRVRL